MKKNVAISLIIVMLILFFCKSKAVYATGIFQFGQEESLTEIQNGVEAENFNKLQESGTVSTNGETRQENVSTQVDQTTINLGNRIVGYFFMALPMIANNILSKITSNNGEIFTIEKTLTNYYDLFNLKNLITSADKGDKQGKSSLLEPIGKNVATWFIGVRNLSIAGSTITLMYVGIRMAISTQATKKAKFKKMLFSWFEGIGIMLTLQIFIVTIILSSNWMVDVLNNTIKTDETVTTVEERTMKNVNTNLDSINEFHSLFFHIIIFIMFTYYECKFFVLYIGRLMRVAFFIIISPLVCLTYPLDKIGDGRAQAFNNWIKEIAISTFMQPIHLLIYMFTIYSMGEIIVRNPLLGVIFLAMLSHMEKTVKSLLKLKTEFGPGLKEIRIKEFRF